VMGLEAAGMSVWCRCRRFDNDIVVNIFCFCFLGGKSETCLPVRLLLHCNVRHGIGDAPTACLLFLVTACLH
jgi:hypothetical protein